MPLWFYDKIERFVWKTKNKIQEAWKKSVESFNTVVLLYDIGMECHLLCQYFIPSSNNPEQNLLISNAKGGLLDMIWPTYLGRTCKMMSIWRWYDLRKSSSDFSDKSTEKWNYNALGANKVRGVTLWMPLCVLMAHHTNQDIDLTPVYCLTTQQ